jgi:hypothetical protein
VAQPRKYAGRSAVELAVVTLILGTLVVGIGGLRVSRGEVRTRLNDEGARQVTIFGVIATPGGKGVDAKLLRIKSQLHQLMPDHGFKLLDAQTRRMVAGDSIPCSLGGSYRVETHLIQPLDDNGMVRLRCELFHDQDRLFSTLVKTPSNQLFFCQRALDDGSQLLIGIGAR